MFVRVVGNRSHKFDFSKITKSLALEGVKIVSITGNHFAMSVIISRVSHVELVN